MAQDVVPALNEKIQKSFKSGCLKDRRLTQISKRIRDGTANMRDAHDYAEHLGEHLSDALIENLTAETLPNGQLYYNIAQRTVIPNLEENYNLVNDVTKEIQAIADKKAKIGLSSVKADFPSSRINGLIDKMTSDNIVLDEAVKWLREPIVNNSEAFVDDYVKANAQFRSNVGLKTTITRTVASGCCKWCEDLAGTYDYDEELPDDIYRRHEFCRCVVTFQSRKTSENVWTKRSWESTPEELERRENIGKVSKMTVDERLSKIGQYERDQEIRAYQKVTGYDRKTAAQDTKRKSPEQIARKIKEIQEEQKNKARR